MTTELFDNVLLMTVVFIVGLFIVYYSYNTYQKYITRKDTIDPRPIPQCPDYWEAIGPNKCRNIHKIGSCRTGQPPNDTIDFNNDIFTNKETGNYMKCRWSKECHSPWEGLDNLCS